MTHSTLTNTVLHDDLLLAQEDFSRIRMVIFYGRSGAGKSSAMHWLSQNHPEFVGVLSTKPDRSNAPWHMVDEILTWRDLPVIWRELRKGHRLLVASHVSPHAYHVFRGFGAQKHFWLDDRLDKLKRWFARDQIVLSDATLARFHAQYGANYTDAQLILERASLSGERDLRDFDRVLRRFERECRIQHHDPAQDLTRERQVVTVTPLVVSP